MFEVYQFTFSPVPCVLWFSVGHLSDYSLMNLITFVVFDESTHTYTKMSQHNAMNSIKKSFYLKIYFFTLILAHSSIYFTQPLNSLSMYGGKYSYEWEIFIKFKKKPMVNNFNITTTSQFKRKTNIPVKIISS